MDAKALLERSYPYAIGLISAIAAIKWSGQLLPSSSAAGIDLRQIASAGLNIFGLFTGLLFSVYLLAIAPGGGFFEKIFATKTFALFRRYVVEAILLGSLATAVFVPLMSTELSPQRAVWNTPFMAVTAFATGAAVSGFYRVFSVFLVMVGAASKIRHSRPR